MCMCANDNMNERQKKMADIFMIRWLLLFTVLQFVKTEMWFTKNETSDYLYNEGSTKVFDCSYNSTTPIKRIDWYRDDLLVSSYNRLYTEEFFDRRQIMKLSRFKPRDSGVYKCVVFEAGHMNSKDVTIERKFYIPPTKVPYIITYNQDYLQVDVGDSVKFKCLVSKYYTKSYKWLKNGKEIKSDYKHIKIKPYKFLRIKKVSFEDTSIFTCSVENEIGRTEVTYMLKVEATNKTASLAPRLTHDIKSIVDVVLNNVNIDCSLLGARPMNITWYKDNKTLIDNPRAGRFGYEYSNENQTLIINRILPADAGKYTCAAKNIYGSFSHTFSVDPQERRISEPQFLNKDGIKEFQAYIGSDVTVELLVVSWGTAHIQLLYHNVTTKSSANESTQLDVIQTPRLFQIIPNSKSTHAETRKLQFFFRNISAKDFGTYSVMAGNVIGFDVYQFVIEEVLIPSVSSTQKSKEKIKSNVVFIILATLVACLLLMLPVILFYWFNRSRKNINNNDSLLRLEKISVQLNLTNGGIFTNLTDKPQSPRKIHFNSSRLSSCQTEKEYFYQGLPPDPEWEVPLENIEFKGLCGEGAFGKVLVATVHALQSHPAPLTCAVKTLKDNAMDQELKDLLSEIQVMKSVGQHKNIINLLGVCSQQNEIFMIVEYCTNGNLRTFLKKRRPTMPPLPPPIEVLNLRHLTSFCLQVAEGMEYLAQKKCIHRDIAARNILVAEDHVVKIADFGLARDIHVSDYYRKCTDGRLPVKWMAMEALFDRVYTTQSDIWSFGILLWEIITFGGSPYPGIPVENLFDLLKQGYRMEQPVNCTDEMYGLMLNCWKEIPTKRPTFSELIKDLQKMMSDMNEAEYLNLKPPIDNTYFTESVSTPVDEECDSLKDMSHTSSSSIFEKDKFDVSSNSSISYFCNKELTVDLPNENDGLLTNCDGQETMQTRL